MGKISDGRFEIFTTKQDAIDKFMQMQGVCREEISGKKGISFYCSKKGEIYIFHPTGRRNYGDDCPVSLSGNIIEQDGKTYVTYTTKYSKSDAVSKVVNLIISIIFILVAITLAILGAKSEITLVVLISYLAISIYQLVFAKKDKEFAPKDSSVMINELEKRVEAINLWDK